MLTPDPQIAPGYTYQLNPPPDDGFYTITNNTTSWGWFAATSWANIGDNSSDPNGYMMVVNASFDTGLFYEQVVEGLCENTLYFFSADVFNLFENGGGIKPNISFLLDGVVVYETGDVPENSSWNTYGFTFTTAPGQTSLTLALRNNAPGGIGNDLALDNISFRACGPEAFILPAEVANICEDGAPISLEATIVGGQYDSPVVQWQESFDEGQTWQDIPGAESLTHLHTQLSAGRYYYRYLLAESLSNLANPFCRVNSNVKIVNVVPKFYTVMDTLCQGLSYAQKDSLYSKTGIYVDSFLTVLGCDSIVSLDLTIVPDAGLEALFSISDPTCEDQSDGSISMDTILNGKAPFTIFVNGAVHPSGDLDMLSEGVYQFMIQDRYACNFDTSISLVNPPPFVVDLGGDEMLDMGKPLAITPFISEPAENFIWTFADSIICEPTCESLFLLPGNSGWVSLTANSNMNGCVDSDSLYVEVQKVRRIFIPNVFSPNDDGRNDQFTIMGALPNVQEVEQLLIYNRWGSLVFEGRNLMPNDLSAGWDGTFKGKEQEAGVYVYLARVRFLDGEVLVYQGDVSIVR